MASDIVDELVEHIALYGAEVARSGALSPTVRMIELLAKIRRMLDGKD